MGVTADVSDVALKATLISTAVVALKFYITIGFQGAARVSAGSRPPEDQALFPNAGAQDFDGSSKNAELIEDEKMKQNKQKEQRWLRIISNDLENIPLSLVIIWGSLLSPWNEYVHAAGAGIFALARIGHTVSYALQLQPHRTIFWFTGVVVTFLLLINAIVGVFVN